MYHLDLRSAEAIMAQRRDQAIARDERRRLLAECRSAPPGRLSGLYKRLVARLGQRLVIMGQYLERSGLPQSSTQLVD
jgi:hypothetical protein